MYIKLVATSDCDQYNKKCAIFYNKNMQKFRSAIYQRADLRVRLINKKSWAVKI